MKKSILITLSLFALTCSAMAQTTYNPSCYSNAIGWTISSIDQNYDGTYIHLSVYNYSNNYQFYINPGMYIRNHNGFSTEKYAIESFMDNNLGQAYSLQPFTEYNFTLKFPRLPADWTDIDLEEPKSPDNSYTAWYWDYLSLNKPSTQRFKLDNFLIHDGMGLLKQTVHPLTNLSFYKYAVDDNSIRVVLYYQGGYVTDLKIDFYLDLVSSITIVYDNDFIEPFTLLEVMRGI